MRSSDRPAVPDHQVPRRRHRTPVPLLLLALLLTALTLGTAAPASAAPVYEITGEWEAGTPGTVAKGDVVTGIFRVNVNDDAPAPSNEPVDNVLLKVTLQHAQFRGLPDVCLTTGEGLDPVSSVSEDGRTLTCNLGSVKQGTAVVVQTPVVADGVTGDQLSAVGSINGQDAALSPIHIANTFGMDMLWGTPSAIVVPWSPEVAGFDFEWTLFQDRGSEPGPDSVSYDVDVNLGTGQPLEPSRFLLTAPYDVPCTPYANGSAAEGHPWSNYGPANRQAPFVKNCTLEQTGPNSFRLTLSGIDYSQVQVPTEDSAGNPMPSDRVAVASGSIWLQVRNLTQSTGATLEASAPTYTSTTGLTDRDEPGNNTSSKAIVLPGGWSHGYGRPAGGTTWDNTLKLAPGTDIQSFVHVNYFKSHPAPAETPIGECKILDTRFSTYKSVQENLRVTGGAETVAPQGTGTFQWFVGVDPTLDPSSPSYDPNASTVCGATSGWVDTEPADKSTVKAVRWTSTVGAVGDREFLLYTTETIKADAPIGQDVWSWAAVLVNGAWIHNGRETDGTNQLTPVPGGRYPYTTGMRDVLHVVYAFPQITKAADRAVVRPGEPATFTLNYSANGSGTLPSAVDDYRIVDTLPAGMTYVEGSATPAPAVSTDAQGREVLTWELDAVPTNAVNTLTYQAVADASVTPGQTLINTATSSLRGETSRPATAQVTVSSSGYTQISKTADTPFIPNLSGEGDGEGSWTVNVRSFDPLPQAFTDTIDILPWEGDKRGTDFEGSYALTDVELLDGQRVYYTDADPASLSDDPAAAANGAPNAPSAMWTTTKPADPTAIRVIGPVLEPGAQQRFRVHITTDGADGEDVYVNRAQGRAGHTELLMRTSAPMSVADYYSASLKKFVQDRSGQWHDANDAADYPVFKYGDTVRYRIVVTNTGQGTLTGIKVTDDKQPALGAFTVDTLEPGDSQSHEYELTLDESVSGALVNTASATADTPKDSGVPPTINSDPAGFEVANYTTVKSADPAPGTPVAPGQVVTYSVTLTQQGTAPATASFSDDLADVLDDARYNGDVAASSGEVRVRDGHIVWNGTIPVDGKVTVTYSVTIRGVEALRKQGSFELVNAVASDGCAVADGETVDCGTTHPVGVFEYAKTADPASGTRVQVGDTVTYTVTVAQQGTGPVPGARLVDDLSGVLDDADYNRDAKASAGTVSVKGESLAWTGDLEVGQKVRITYSVTVADSGDDTLRNVVTSPNGEGVCVKAADGNAGCRTAHDKADRAGVAGFLPSTGGPALWLTGSGLGLLLLGGAVLVVARQRRRSDEGDLVTAA